MGAITGHMKGKRTELQFSLTLMQFAAAAYNFVLPAKTNECIPTHYQELLCTRPRKKKIIGKHCFQSEKSGKMLIELSWNRIIANDLSVDWKQCLPNTAKR